MENHRRTAGPLPERHQPGLGRQGTILPRTH
jgi:hypothetical protein